METNSREDNKNAESFSIESDKSKKKIKEPKPERGIDTMFRTTLNNHNNLSGLVDNKAKILLSVIAIIIPVSLTTIIPKLDNPSNAHLILPTMILIVTSVIAITFAILDGQLRLRVGKASGDSEDSRWRVDALAGATLTSYGVNKMIRFWLGPQGYGPYQKRLRQEGFES